MNSFGEGRAVVAGACGAAVAGGVTCVAPPVLPVVAAVPVGAGADAAVVAGRLAQPAMSAVLITNDIAMSLEPRVTMTPPFRTTNWVSQRRANPITATAATTKDCSLRCCLV